MHLSYFSLVCLGEFLHNPSEDICMWIQVAITVVFAVLKHCWQYMPWVTPLWVGATKPHCVITASLWALQTSGVFVLQSLHLQEEALVLLINR